MDYVILFYVILQKIIRENHLGSGAMQRVVTKSMIQKRKKLVNWTLSKLNTFALWKTLLRGKYKLQNGQKYLSDKGLVFIIYKEFLKLNIKKIQLENVQKTWADISLKRMDIQISNKHMKRYSASLAIKEIQIKTAMKDPACRNEDPMQPNK